MIFPTKLAWQFVENKVEPKNIDITKCALCGEEIDEGFKISEAVSENFTDYVYFRVLDSDYVCKYCYNSLKEPKFRRYSFVMNKSEVIYLKRNEIADYLFDKSLNPPFIFCITESMKKHMVFKAMVNYDETLFFIQKEDYTILFDRNEYRPVYNTMKKLYQTFSKSHIRYGEYPAKLAIKYGVSELKQDEEIISKHRGTQVFDLLLFVLNREEDKKNGMRKNKRRTQKLFS